MNRSRFFSAARARPFAGTLSQQQVDGLTFILDQWDETGFTDRRWLAYALATAFHETAFTMQPIREYGRGRGRDYGVKDPDTGEAYYGRGFVQLTWKFNYETASRHLGIDCVRNPDLVMQPDHAAFILFQGMADGWFTGRKFTDYLNAERCDYLNARRIVNGTDRADTIAGYAVQFKAALDAARAAATGPPPAAPTSAPRHWLAHALRTIWRILRP